MQKKYEAQRALDKVEQDAFETKVVALTGTTRKEAPGYQRDDRYWTIREAIPYEYFDPELSGWKNIYDRLYPLCADILSRTAQTKAGLAVQVKAIQMAAADLWDDPDAEDGSHERAFIEAVFRFVGITPAQLR
jgi:hypothetical protein